MRQKWALTFLFSMDVEHKYCHLNRGLSWKQRFAYPLLGNFHHIMMSGGELSN